MDDTQRKKVREISDKEQLAHCKQRTLTTKVSRNHVKQRKEFDNTHNRMLKSNQEKVLQTELIKATKTSGKSVSKVQ